MTNNEIIRQRPLYLKRLEKENGSTRTSVENFQKILGLGYVPVYVIHIGDHDVCRWLTKVFFIKSESKTLYNFTFKGLSSGYEGEGSRGFTTILKLMFGINFKKVLNKISKFQSGIKYTFINKELLSNKTGLEKYSYKYVITNPNETKIKQKGTRLITFGKEYYN